MRNLALMWVLAACLLGCGGKDRDAKELVEYDDYLEVVDHYNQILVKKWQEKADWRELAGDPLDTIQNPRQRRDYIPYMAWDTAKNVLKEYKVAEFYKDFKSQLRFINGNYMIRYLRRLNSSKQEQIWILISSTNGKRLSTHKDTIQIARKSKQKILDEKRQEQEEEREFRINSYYKKLIDEWKIYLDSGRVVNVCPRPSSMLHNFYSDKVNSAHLQKIDSIHLRKGENHMVAGIDVGGTSQRESIDQHSFRQRLKSLYGFSDENKNMDSVTAIKIAAAAAAECYGSDMTPFNARLMGDNKEYWMVYCFPTVLDDMDLQERCYEIRISQYEDGKRFDFFLRNGCPVVFTILISRENGQVLFIDILR